MRLQENQSHQIEKFINKHLRGKGGRGSPENLIMIDWVVVLCKGFIIYFSMGFMYVRTYVGPADPDALTEKSKSSKI